MMLVKFQKRRDSFVVLLIFEMLSLSFQSFFLLNYVPLCCIKETKILKWIISSLVIICTDWQLNLHLAASSEEIISSKSPLHFGKFLGLTYDVASEIQHIFYFHIFWKGWSQNLFCWGRWKDRSQTLWIDFQQQWNFVRWAL